MPTLKRESRSARAFRMPSSNPNTRTVVRPFPAPNDNDPFRARPLKDPRKFGRGGPPKGPRIVGPKLRFGPVALLTGAIAVGLYVIRDPQASPKPPDGFWRRTQGPHRYVPPYDGAPVVQSETVYDRGDGRITGQALPVFDTDPVGSTVAPNADTLGYWTQWDQFGNGDPTQFRHAQTDAFERVETATAAGPEWPTIALPIGDPFSPADGFVLPPKPEPYPRTDVATVPKQHGYAKPLPPGANPAVSVTIGNATPPVVNRGAVHAKEPPPRRTKERKTKAQRIAWYIGNVYGSATEWNDALEVLWDALPKSAKSKSFYKGVYVQPSLTTKYQDVYENFSEVNIAEFVDGYAKNHLQDFILSLGKDPSGRIGVGRFSNVSKSTVKEQRELQLRDDIAEAARTNWRNASKNARAYEALIEAAVYETGGPYVKWWLYYKDDAYAAAVIDRYDPHMHLALAASGKLKGE